MLELLLRSHAEVKVLGEVLFHEGLHLREISRRAGISPSEAKSELDKLTAAGVLRPERKGNLILFHLNPQCPFLNELKTLYLKTEGIFEQMRRGLSTLKGLKFVFVYGSMAQGDFRERSDVDLLAVGDIDEETFTKHIYNLQRRTNREINYILWSKGDLLRKLKTNGAFINSLLKKKRVWLVGNEDGFAGIVAKETDRKSKTR